MYSLSVVMVLLDQTKHLTSVEHVVTCVNDRCASLRILFLTICDDIVVYST